MRDTPRDTPGITGPVARKSRLASRYARNMGFVNRAAVQPRRVLPTSPFKRSDSPPPSTDGYSVGGRVTHDRLGLGRIVAVDPQFLTVDFGCGMVRQLKAGTKGWQSL
ncbi:MAG: hypothetical protein QG622_2597 [Actinomycetota bacterium]|nr:hypothetical protein [Actinomycetota bacterium]